jgi:hypothetical protein
MAPASEGGSQRRTPPGPALAIAAQNEIWRERYAIQGGQLVLTEVTYPVVVSTDPYKVTWVLATGAVPGPGQLPVLRQVHLPVAEASMGMALRGEYLFQSGNRFKQVGKLMAVINHETDALHRLSVL